MLPTTGRAPRLAAGSAQARPGAHLGLVGAAPHGLHELLHLLSLVQGVPQRVLRAHELALQPLELGRRGRVNEGIAPLVHQGLLFVLHAAGETESPRESLGALVCTRARVCWERTRPPASWLLHKPVSHWITLPPGRVPPEPSAPL